MQRCATLSQKSAGKLHWTDSTLLLLFPDTFRTQAAHPHGWQNGRSTPPSRNACSAMPSDRRAAGVTPPALLTEVAPSAAQAQHRLTPALALPEIVSTRACTARPLASQRGFKGLRRQSCAQVRQPAVVHAFSPVHQSASFRRTADSATPLRESGGGIARASASAYPIH